MAAYGWKVSVRRVCVGSLVALLAACGGGGGGGDGAADASDLRLSNVSATGTTQRVYASALPLESVTVTADVTGNLQRLNGRTLYIIVTDPDGLFEATPSVFLSSNGIGNSIVLTGKSTQGRAAGTYHGPLTIRVCLDSACTDQFEGSPAVVPLQVEVLPGLQVPPPLVIDLAFGQTPSAIDVPVTVPADANGFSVSLSPLPGGNSGGALTLEPVTPPAVGLRILPRALPVGSYTQTFTLESLAIVNGRGYSLQATLPVTVNVSATPGLIAKIDPPQVGLEALSSGSIIPQQFGPNVTVLAADGRQFPAVSRTQYLPAGPGGVLDAGGIAWLNVVPGPGPNFWDTAFQPQAYVCQFVPTTRCLGPGRYAANVYFRTPGGAELPVPLQVTIDVR